MITKSIGVPISTRSFSFPKKKDEVPSALNSRYLTESFKGDTFHVNKALIQSHADVGTYFPEMVEVTRNRQTGSVTYAGAYEMLERGNLVTISLDFDSTTGYAHFRGNCSQGDRHRVIQVVQDFQKAIIAE